MIVMREMCYKQWPKAKKAGYVFVQPHEYDGVGTSNGYRDLSESRREGLF